MPATKNMDYEVRKRIRAWLAHYKRTRGWTNQRLADEIGVEEATVTMVLNGTRTGGLDLLVKMHRQLGRSADDILDTYPAEKTP